MIPNKFQLYLAYNTYPSVYIRVGIITHGHYTSRFITAGVIGHICLTCICMTKYLYTRDSDGAWPIIHYGQTETRGVDVF